MTEAVCSQCRQSFLTYPSRISKAQNICCSKKCQGFLRRSPVEKRFWQYVKKTKSCWIWIGAKAYWGYGCITVIHGKMEGAHRVSWKLHYGVIPDGAWILHKCDNPACVRPDHLFLGSPRDNSRDMLNKGRYIVKLTKEQMHEIRQKYILGNVSQQKLAEHYRIGQSSISRIIRKEYPSHQ